MVDWQYDSVYNRTYWSDTALGSLTYSDNAMNQYTAVGAATPAYDSRGNITSGCGNGLTLAYDSENRLVSAGAVSYGYDLMGRRNRRTRAPYADDRYVWDGAHIIAEYDGLSGSLTKKYIYGPGIDQPVAMINVDAYGAEMWYYYYADALGSVRLMTDAGGAIVESYTYDVYGRPQVMTASGGDGNWLTEDVTGTYFSPIGNPYLFTGRRWDGDTKLYYYRFRDYSPDLGRFLQPDPAGYVDTMNLYAYCGNNPVNWIDPWGLCSKEEEDGSGLRHVIGPALVAAGQRVESLKPVGALGSKKGSSVASYALRKVFPQKMGTRILGTRVLGGALGRAVPIIGAALIGLDLAIAFNEFDDQLSAKSAYPYNDPVDISIDPNNPFPFY